MSTRRGGTSKGPPKHQNSTVWKPNRAAKKTEKDPGGKLNPYPKILGVCHRCRDQIEWRRKYGKYKLLREPAKCGTCTKRNVRQPYMALCNGCASERNVCAKCCKPSKALLSSDLEKERADMKRLEDALGSLRERDRRSLLRAMAKGGDKKEMADRAEKLRDKREEGSEDDNPFGSSDEDDEDEDEADDEDEGSDSAEEDNEEEEEDKSKGGKGPQVLNEGSDRNLELQALRLEEGKSGAVAGSSKKGGDRASAQGQREKAKSREDKGDVDEDHDDGDDVDEDEDEEVDEDANGDADVSSFDGEYDSNDDSFRGKKVGGANRESPLGLGTGEGTSTSRDDKQ